MHDIFTLEEVSYEYSNSQLALSGINLSVKEGEILSIIGSNGSGKSTLLHLLCGLVFPNKGNIKFKGEVFHEQTFKNKSFNNKFRSSIGYIFQNSDAQLFCPTVFDELIFGPLQLGFLKNEAYERAKGIAEMLNIQDLLNRPPYMLSGGEKKRVAIGAILTSNPEILVLDEPNSGLDPKTQSFIIELLFRLNEAGKTIIIATHHLELVNHFQSRVVVLSEKHTIEMIGTSEEILSNVDLLTRTNLISAYPHIHNGTIHKHIFTDGFIKKHRH